MPCLMPACLVILCSLCCALIMPTCLPYAMPLYAFATHTCHHLTQALPSHFCHLPLLPMCFVDTLILHVAAFCHPPYYRFLLHVTCDYTVYLTTPALCLQFVIYLCNLFEFPTCHYLYTYPYLAYTYLPLPSLAIFYAALIVR